MAWELCGRISPSSASICSETHSWEHADELKVLPAWFTSSLVSERMTHPGEIAESAYYPALITQVTHGAPQLSFALVLL